MFKLQLDEPNVIATTEPTKNYRIIKMNKLFTAFLLLFTFIAISAADFRESDIHPYHVGSVEMKYNSTSKTFEVSAKFFLDDLENALKDKYGKPVRFHDPKYKQEIDRLLQKYCEDYLKIKADGKFIKINYLGYEEDSEAVNIYLESEKISAPKKVEAAVSFLYNLFDDQMNIIHMIVGGKRESDRLTYPDRYLYRNF